MTERTGTQDVLRDIGIIIGRHGLRIGRPTLVLVHGTCGSGRSWGAQIGPLDRRVNVAALDLPGHGDSAGPPLDRIEDLAAWVIRVVEGLPVSGSMVLGGVSLGGAVVMKAALARPGLAQALVLIGTAARFQDHTEMMERVRRDFQGAAADLAEGIFSAWSGPVLMEQSRELMSRVPPEVFRADLRAGSGMDLRADIGRIRVPALVVAGGGDRLVSLDMARELAEGLPRGELRVIEKAGHLVMAERHPEVNRAILEFILGLDNDDREKGRSG